jgi:general secretion pathway protein E
MDHSEEKSEGIPRLSLKDYPNLMPVNSLPVKFMREAKCLPFKREGNTLHVAMVDPFDTYSLEGIEMATGCRLKIYQAKEGDILDAIERLYGEGATSMERIIGDLDQTEEFPSNVEEDVDSLRDMASEAPVIRLVNLIISKAIEARASDIHLEPFENDFKVRYRIDGVLQDQESPPPRLVPAITSRIKIMAKMDIAERRLPQDGRIRIKPSGKDIDIRVSTIPTVFGESVVMRLLDRSSVVFSLEKLGFPTDVLTSFNKLIAKPHGMILVTGPTGSGKSTTLYASLEKINSPDKKIITVEDPVEYQLAGVNQIQVKPHIGLTFANCLRSVVRQDPDVILIGEIRDRETAEIAIHSALTGHLVFSTLHTNDAAGAVSRMLEMGVEDYLLSSSLIGVLAQRLVRVICPDCREPFVPGPDIAAELGIGSLDNVTLFRGRGCEKCSSTGFFGRTGIYELITVSEDIRHLILDRMDATSIRKKATEAGTRTLREDGWQKVKEGSTTVSEVLRVTMEE